MSWEHRGARRYYYRKRRQGGRVISEYLGAGQSAQAIAALDTLERELRQDERLQRESHRALDAQIDHVGDLVRALTYSLLVTAGYHTHKGTWRLKRHD